MSNLSPLIPFRLETSAFDAMPAEITELNKRYGLRRIMLCWPPKSCRLTGLPSFEEFRHMGQLCAELRKLVPAKVELNWWCACTLKSGAGFTPVTDLRGKTAPYSACPLDPEFRTNFCTCIQNFIREAKSPMVLLEDDFQLGNHPGLWFGCCCDRHLEQFNREHGTMFSRNELLRFLAEDSPEAQQLHLEYTRFGGRTLASFAADISKAITAVAPETRVGMCQDGSWARDGNATVEIARALAGKHRPFVRVYGSSYVIDQAADFPEMELYSRYSLEHFSHEIEYFMEIDTYPHTAFFASAGRVRTLTTQSLLAGEDDFLYYALQYLNHPLEEKRYIDFWKHSKVQLEALKQEALHRHLVGPQVIFCPDAHSALPCDGRSSFDSRSPWSQILGRMGIPYTTREASCALLSGKANTAVLNDHEIHKLLSRGLILDGSAAENLLDRGFGPLLGIEQGTLSSRLPSLERNLNTDEELYNFLLAPAGSEGGHAISIRPMKRAETLTRYESDPGDVISPGIIRFQNRLGGRVAVMPLTLPSESSNIFCYRKQRLLLELIEWCAESALPAAVVHIPNVWLTAAVDETDESLLLSAVNLSPDRLQKIEIKLSAEYAVKKIEIMNQFGKWIPAKTADKADGVVVKCNFEILKPVILKLFRRKS